MKIDLVLTAGNLNSHYTKIFPLIYKIWNIGFKLPVYLILVSNNIPDYLEEFKEFIILFKPIDNINDIYIAQFIRILYPALFDKKNILITDLDIFPVSKNYFIKSIEKYDDDKFITFTDRYIKQNMYAICYNVANSNVWKDIFNINSIEDVKRIIIDNYNELYTGRKNCEGWYTDQKTLFKLVNLWNKKTNNLIILKDDDLNFKRLNNRSRDKKNIIPNFQNILDNIDKYSDIHCIKPYSKTGWYLRQITEKLIQN